VFLTERADSVPFKVHADFRLFACMNPPFTSAGKKQLPAPFRNRFTEIYVDELLNTEDLMAVVMKNSPIGFDPNLQLQIVKFYQEVKHAVSTHEITN
jgi:midasin (ATPase involved in ribosome maturation)